MGDGQPRQRVGRRGRSVRAPGWALLAVILAPALAQARPATLYVGAPHTPSVLYGPADMLCDMFKCRIFGLPMPQVNQPGTIVEFGLPELAGQSRIDVRRCFQICRASVLGYQSTPTSRPESAKPTLFITPIEMRLE